MINAYVACILSEVYRRDYPEIQEHDLSCSYIYNCTRLGFLENLIMAACHKGLNSVDVDDLGVVERKILNDLGYSIDYVIADGLIKSWTIRWIGGE